jgi:hypothetical protein
MILFFVVVGVSGELLYKVKFQRPPQCTASILAYSFTEAFFTATITTSLQHNARISLKIRVYFFPVSHLILLVNLPRYSKVRGRSKHCHAIQADRRVVTHVDTLALLFASSNQ